MAVKGGAYGVRVGGVQDRHVDPARPHPEGAGEDIRRKAAAAHAHDESAREACVADPAGKALQVGRVALEVDRRVEPAEALDDRGPGALVRGPEGGVVVEQPLGPALVAGTGDGLLECRRRVAEVEARMVHRGRAAVGHGASQWYGVGSMGSRLAQATSPGASVDIRWPSRCLSAA
jgi:hypothetical protein